MTSGLSVLVPLVGIVAACAAVGLCRATYYRSKQPPAPPTPRPPSHRALGADERREVLAVLDSERFADKAPSQVYATLLDEGRRLCSIRTMYRVLAAAAQVRERRDQRRHPTYVKPRLVARAPNQVWPWDITKVSGPVRGMYYSLYVVLDIFSRAVVGWEIARTESAAVAQHMLADASRRHGIVPGQLTVHSDRGSPMTAKSTALRHSGIALLTPGDVHRGTATAIVAARQVALDAAYREHPEGANFTGANLAGADLEGARLTGRSSTSQPCGPRGSIPARTASSRRASAS